MKNLLLMALLCVAPLPALAKCGPACNANVHALMNGPTEYTLKVDDRMHAHVSVTWTARNRSKLKPVQFEGIAPVRLRHTTVHGFEMPNDDVCHGVVTLIEQHQIDDEFDVYQVPVNNTECN